MKNFINQSTIHPQNDQQREHAYKAYIHSLSAILFLLACTISLRPNALQAQSGPASTQPCAQDVIVQSGDTLSLIAGRTLNNQGAYQRIINATNARATMDSSYTRISNANAIAVGWKLCIPAAGDADATNVTVLGGDYALDNRTVDGAIGELPTISQRVDADGVHPMTIDYLRKQSYPGSALTITQSLAPGANYNRYIAAYQSEGLTLNALLMIPHGQRPPNGWPVIIFNHGYIPPAEYRTTERYEAYMDGFARSGYIVLRPDLRGHGTSQGVANGAYGHPDYTIDILNAVSSVKQFSDADPTRIGMWGHSMGGYLTLRAMVVSPDIRAGVIWSGVVASYEDLLQLWTMGAQIGLIPEGIYHWGTQLLANFGTPEENPAFWSSISANSYLTDISGPLQLHHGSGDVVVPLAFSNLLLEDVVETDGSVEYYMYPNDDHSLTASFDTAMARSIAFFDTHVKNAP